MSVWGMAVVGGICAFMVGGIPFGLLVGRLRGVDVRRSGSGNIGASNVGRLLGPAWGGAVFLLDMLKGLVPTVTAGMIVSSPSFADGPAETARSIGWLVVGVAAVLGHIYSPFLGFRGGKGVSTAFGAALGIYPDLTYPALAAAGAWVLTAAASRFSSLASVIASAVFPVAYIAFTLGDPRDLRSHLPFVTFTCFVTLLVTWRHRDNLGRLVSGTEPRLGDSGKPIPSSDATEP